MITSVKKKDNLPRFTPRRRQWSEEVDLALALNIGYLGYWHDYGKPGTPENVYGTWPSWVSRLIKLYGNYLERVVYVQEGIDVNQRRVDYRWAGDFLITCVGFRPARICDYVESGIAKTISEKMRSGFVADAIYSHVKNLENG